MKRKIVWTLFFIAMLSLNLAAIAQEREEMDGYKCSPAKVAGTWGYSETGTMIVTIQQVQTPLPYASVGSYTLDSKGNVLGHRIASLGGSKMEATFTGTATVNPDCTGKITLNFPGNPPAEKFIVYVDNAREARMIITIAPFPSVLVTEAKKVSQGNGNEQRE